MLPGIQLLGILFGLVMVYMTFLYYKRKNYGTAAFIFWMGIWTAFLVLAIFPTFVYGVMGLLDIQRTADFFVIGALLLYSVVIFKLYVRNKQLEDKVEKIVRKVALDKAYRRKK
ncbi:MAG: DUF2304 domain-containing protein [Nanoarchaeota archaeon]